MPSKFDRLRAGEVVEIEPGRKGRLNLNKKTFETSDGRTMFVGNDPDFFPSSENALSYSKEKESLNREIKKSPAGEFLYQFGNQGVGGALKNSYNKIAMKGDEYLRSKQINQEVSNEISERSPWTSTGATVASFIPDIALTKGMNAATAAPALTALHAGPRLVEEPMEVAGEALLSAAGGHLIDKGASALNRIAQRRGAIRALPAEREAVANRNMLGKQAVEQANLAQNEEFNLLKKNVKNVNETRLKDYENELLVRQNKMIESDNIYNQAKANRSFSELEKKRLQDEYKLAKEHYETTLNSMPQLQREAQKEYSANVVKNAEGISKAFPNESKIYSSQFNVPDFIENSIQKSAIAGTKEANQSSRILKSLFPEGEILTGKELANRYKALEGVIQKSTPEVSQVLNEFKTHMGSTLTPILADNLAYHRIVPALKTQVKNEVMSALDSMGLAESGLMSRSYMKKRASGNIDNLFRDMTTENFMNKFKSGEIKDQILNSVLNPQDFSGSLGGLSKGKKKLPLSSAEAEMLGLDIRSPGDKKYQEFSNFFSSKLDKALAKAELKMIAIDIDAATKLGGKVKKTYGMAENLPGPVAPIYPSTGSLSNGNNLSPLNPPPKLPMPAKPNLMNEPNLPIPQSFSAELEPMLAPAQGMSDRAGDFLEKNLMEGKGLLNNPIAKLGGLKYLLGKAALPVEAAYAGMKTLTSPTQMGQVARMSFKQGGIQAIESWAERYPSYRNGILQNPQERRSLTKEIEDDYDIPIEKKAIFQSKINRGKPLNSTL